MPMRCYLLSATWPVDALTNLGKLSWVLTGGGSCHLGVLFCECTDECIARHSEARVSEFNGVWVGQQDVTWDVHWDQTPKFQSWNNVQYFGTRGAYVLYPLRVDPALLHRACYELSVQSPKSEWYNRFDALFGGVIPMHSGIVQHGVGPGSCAGVTLRAIAQAKAHGNARAQRDDFFVQRELGMQRPTLSHPFEPRRLTGYTPRGALEALQAAPRPVVGGPIYGFEAAIRETQSQISFRITR